MIDRPEVDAALLAACGCAAPSAGAAAQPLGCLIEPERVADVGSPVVGVIEAWRSSAAISCARARCWRCCAPTSSAPRSIVAQLPRRRQRRPAGRRRQRQLQPRAAGSRRRPAPPEVHLAAGARSGPDRIRSWPTRSWRRRASSDACSSPRARAGRGAALAAHHPQPDRRRGGRTLLAPASGSTTSRSCASPRSIRCACSSWCRPRCTGRSQPGSCRQRAARTAGCRTVIARVTMVDKVDRPRQQHLPRAAGAAQPRSARCPPGCAARPISGWNRPPCAARPRQAAPPAAPSSQRPEDRTSSQREAARRRAPTRRADRATAASAHAPRPQRE